jgi:hypothetical protein
MVAAQLGWFRRRPEHLGHDRPDPERLLDHGVEVVLRFARLDLGDQALECGRGAQQPLECPPDRRRGRFVAREQEGDQLVAELAIGQRVARFVSGGEQHGEDVLAQVAIGIVAAPLDLLVEEPVDLVAQPDETAPGTAGSEVLLDEQQERVRRRQPRQDSPELGNASGIADAEDRPDDHLHRDRLRDGAGADGVPLAPRVDLAVGDLLDQLRVVGDRLAVKRREHQLAHPHVMLAVEQQDGRRPGDGFHHLAWLADVVLRRLPFEDLLDQLALGDVEQLAGDRVVGPEDAPVSLAHAEPGLDRPHHSKQRLQQTRETRPGNLGGGLGARVSLGLLAMLRGGRRHC